MPKYVRDIRHSVIQTGDALLTHGMSVRGGFVRFWTMFRGKRKGRLRRALRAVRDRELENHLAIGYRVYGQVKVAESTPRRTFEENAVDDYRVRRNKILRIRRWKGLRDPKIHRRACRYLAWLLRKADEEDLPYDYAGAVRSVPWGSRILRALGIKAKNKPDLNFCSEAWVEMLVWCGFCNQLPHDRKELMEIIERERGKNLPVRFNPYAVRVWTDTQPGIFESVTGFYAE